MDYLFPYKSFFTQARRINRAHWVIVLLGLIQVASVRGIGAFETQSLIILGILSYETLTFEWVYFGFDPARAGETRSLKRLLNIFIVQVVVDIIIISLGMQISGGPISPLPLVAALYIGVLATMLPSVYLAAAAIFQMLMFFGLMEGYRQALIEPLFPGQLIIGNIAPGFITWVEVTYLFMVATISILISGNTRQLRKAWQDAENQRAFLDQFNRIVEEALTQSDTQDLYQALVDHIGKVLGADSAYLTRWDEENYATIPVAAYGSMRDIYLQGLEDAKANTITRNLRFIKKPLVIDDVFNTPFLDLAIATRYPTKSVLGLPLFDYPDQYFSGAILIGYDEPHQFTEDEVRRARQVTNVINLINNRVRLQRDAVERAESMQSLIGHISSLTSEMHHDTLIPAVVEAARNLLKAQRAALYLFDPETAQLKFAHSVGLSDQYIERMAQVARQLPGASILNGEKQIFIADITKDKRSQPLLELFKAEGFKSYCIFALESPAGEIGALAVYWDHPHIMSVDEIAIAQLFTDRAASVLRQSYLYQQAAELSLTDPLTGLANRRVLDMRLKEEIQRSQRNGHPFAVLMLDMNGFKRINDTYGHPTGDSVLKEAAVAVKSTLRATDLASRFGGDEFALILPETNVSAAESVWQKINAALAGTNLRLPEDGLITISASVGIAIYPDDATDVNALIEIADQRLYKAKNKADNKQLPPEQDGQL